MTPVRLDSLDRGTVVCMPWTRRVAVVVGRSRRGNVPLDFDDAEPDADPVGVRGDLLVIVLERSYEMPRLAVQENRPAEAVVHTLHAPLSQGRKIA